MPGQKGFAGGTHRARLGSAKVVPTLSPEPLLRGPHPCPRPSLPGEQDLAVRAHRLCNHTDVGSSPGSSSPAWVSFRGHFPFLGLKFSSLKGAKEVPLCLGCVRINEKMPSICLFTQSHLLSTYCSWVTMLSTMCPADGG